MIVLEHALDELASCLTIDTLLDLARRFSETYQNLAKHSTEHFLTTPVTALPTGREQGHFLAIDVGGSNLRVGFVELTGQTTTINDESQANDCIANRIRRSHDKSWPIGDHLKMDQPEDLFLWIGDCMAGVISEAIKSRTIPTDRDVQLGVTFSFPMAQTTLSEATLLPMGKGFAIASKMNLAEMLLAGYSPHCAIPSKGSVTASHPGEPLPRIKIAAITNDTVATFLSLAYAVKAAPNSRVAMGLIVGTGTNATIPMKPTNLHPEKQSQLRGESHSGSVVINTEWTIRGTDAPLEALHIKTKWDRSLDENSDAPGFQPFEYMTSGRYLGEIVRLVFLDTLYDTDIASVPRTLQQKNALPTWFLSEVVARLDKGLLPTRLQEKYPSDEAGFWTPARTSSLCDIARAVQQRSSALIAAACVGLLECVGDIVLSTEAVQQLGAPERVDVDELVIAYTGGTISQYPCWLSDCQQWLDDLITASGTNQGKRLVLKEALDGGIIGAGVLAGMGSQLRVWCRRIARGQDEALHRA